MVTEFARLLALPDDPVTPLRGAVSGVRQVAWAAPLELAEVRIIARALRCTVNDVLLATVAGALGAHLREAHGVDTTALVLRASVPVNLRVADEPVALGNKFGLVFVDLPVGARNPLERVFRVHDAMRAVKGSLQPAMTLTVLGVVGMLPAALPAAAMELFSRKGTLVASNVPGPQAPLHLCGERISEMYFWVPQGGSMGVGVSILSYAGQVFFGIVADRNLLPVPAAVVDRFGPEFERLLLGATVGLLALRPSGHRPPRAGKRGGTRRQTIRPVGST
jgi:diacylglycerol O-acyltransferase / wax synthase